MLSSLQQLIAMIVNDRIINIEFRSVNSKTGKEGKTAGDCARKKEKIGQLAQNNLMPITSEVGRRHPSSSS